MDFHDPKTIVTFLAGVAGAAAMAVTDWRSPMQLVKHLFVGTLTSAFATPLFFPMLSAILDIFKVSEDYHQNSAAFIVGAAGIYVLEFILVAIRKKGEDK